MTGNTDTEPRENVSAAYWLIALEEAPDNAALKAEFEAWLSGSPEHAQAWAEVQAVDDLFAMSEPAYADQWTERGAIECTECEVGVEPHSDVNPAPAAELHPPASRHMPRWQVSAKLAAGLALAASVFLFVLPTLRLHLEADYITASAERRTIELSDGSVVHLGPETAVVVNITDRYRRLELLRGEAFFEVVSIPDVPFKVTSADLVGTVVGTAFNVRLAAQGAFIAVREGLVDVTRTTDLTQAGQRLSAGDWLALDAAGQTKRGAVAPGQVAPWLQNRLVVRDLPLIQVVAELRRYHTGMILMADSELEQKRVSGVYNSDEPITALEALVRAHGGEVTTVTPWLVLISAN